jgi:hypothetical protein
MRRPTPGRTCSGNARSRRIVWGSACKSGRVARQDQQLNREQDGAGCKPDFADLGGRELYGPQVGIEQEQNDGREHPQQGQPDAAGETGAVPVLDLPAHDGAVQTATGDDSMGNE